jgi:hypothetical protein
MATYWRVRTWKFEANGLVGDEISGPIYPFSSLIYVSSDNSTEEQLVCENYFSYYDGINDEYSNIFFENPEKSGSLYTSGITGNLRDPIEAIFGHRPAYSFRVYPEYPPAILDPLPNYFSGVFSIFGKTIPLIVFAIGEIGDVAFANVKATLTPTLWWSYDGMYNTSTGEPLL